MFTYLRSLFEAKERLQELEDDHALLEAEAKTLRAQKHQTTLEELQDKPEDMEVLKEFSVQQRQALYNFLTARAYRLNKDSLRDSALWTRNDLMANTKGAKNAIPFDRDVKPKKPADFLPSVLKDDPLP